MPFGQSIEHAATKPVLEGHGIPMEKYNGRTGTLFEIVQAHAVDLDKPTDGWVTSFRLSCVIEVPNCERGKRTGGEHQ
jgi:hypothetical protein